MNYELLKRLKDAGFPQRHTFISTNCHPSEEMLDQMVVTPTLSELIEACGLQHDVTRTLFSLKYQFLSGFCWRAGYTGEDGCWGISEYGSTPEEAVALLWLALNEK